MNSVRPNSSRMKYKMTTPQVSKKSELENLSLLQKLSSLLQKNGCHLMGNVLIPLFKNVQNPQNFLMNFVVLFYNVQEKIFKI